MNTRTFTPPWRRKCPKGKTTTTPEPWWKKFPSLTIADRAAVDSHVAVEVRKGQWS